MAIELATAYVSLVPTAKNITANIGKELGDPLTEAGKVAGDKTSKSFGASFKDGMKKAAVLGAAVAGAAVAQLVGDSIKAASALSESTNAVNVTFGAAADGILNLGNKAATSLGLSSSAFNGLAVQFSSFATTIAGPGGDVTSTLDDMTTRAADFASVMNLDVNDAAMMFQSGLAGETEPLRKYGLDLSAAAVEAYAMANGIGTAGEALTESEKVQARYGSLMEQTSKTQGDFANTSDGLANQQRILAATFENSKASIGNALMPVMVAIMPVVQKLAVWLGKALPVALTFAKRAFNVMGDVLKKVGVVFGNVFGWLLDNKEVLIGLGATMAIGLGALFVAWAAGAYAALVPQLLLAAAFIATNAPIIAIGLAIGALVAGVIYAYNHFGIFRTVIDALKNAFLAVWNFINDNIVPIFKTLIEVWIAALVLEFKVIKAVITDVLIPAFMAVWNFIGDNIIPIFEKIATTIATVALTVGRVIGTIVGFVTGIPGRITATISSLWNGLTSGITTAKNWVGDRIGEVVGFVTGIPGRIAVAVGLLWEPFKRNITAAKEWVGNRIDDVVDFAQKLPGRISGFFGGMWDGIKNAFKSALNWIIDKWNNFKIPGVSVLGISITPEINFPNIPRFHEGGLVPGQTGANVPSVLRAGELVLTGAQQARLFAMANGATNDAAPGIVVNNYRRDIGVADLNHVLAMARLAA